MAALIVFGIFVVLIFIGTPIGISLATAAMGAIMNFDLGTAMISRNFEANIAKFPLVAIPFFILAGVLMEKAKIVTAYPSSSSLWWAGRQAAWPSRR
jgi:C4-dicarboxylate transporter DctM subunit